MGRDVEVRERAEESEMQGVEDRRRVMRRQWSQEEGDGVEEGGGDSGIHGKCVGVVSKRGGKVFKRRQNMGM